MTMPEIQRIGIKSRESLISPDTCPAFQDAGILLAGLSNTAGGFSFVRHHPDFCQLLTCQEGEGRVWIPGRWAACRTGQAYLTPAETFHAYRSVPRQAWKLAWIMFRPLAGLPSEPTLLHTETAEWAAIIGAIHRESVGLRSALLLRQLTEILSFHLHRLAGQQKHDLRLSNLWVKVDAALQEAWTLDRLASNIHMSTEHLRRLCLRQYGKSPLTILRELRMKRAAILLSRYGDTLETVAEQVGYSDVFAFSKAFKRILGISPSRQRRQ